jgi:hypothetical protein
MKLVCGALTSSLNVVAARPTARPQPAQSAPAAPRPIRAFMLACMPPRTVKAEEIFARNTLDLEQRFTRRIRLADSDPLGYVLDARTKGSVASMAIALHESVLRRAVKDAGRGTGIAKQAIRHTLPSFVCHPPAGREPRHPHSAGTARPLRRQHRDDLHPRSQPRTGRGQEPCRPDVPVMTAEAENTSGWPRRPT